MTPSTADRTPPRLTKLADLARKLAVEIPRQGTVTHRLLGDWVDAEAYGRGRRWSDEPGRTSHLWCARHQDDRCDCSDKEPLPEQSDPVGDMVAAGLHDPVEARRKQTAIEFLERTIASNLVDLLQQYREVSGYATGDIAPPAAVQRPSRGGDCAACDRYVPGSDSDRLRAGLCSTDHRAWLRERDAARDRGEELERSVWLIQRRKWLGEQKVQEPARVDPTDKSVASVEVTHMATGEKLTLTPEQVAVWRTLDPEQQREFAASLGGS